MTNFKNKNTMEKIENKDFIRVMVASVFGVAIIIAALLLGNAYSQKFKEENVISVTGLGEVKFESNLIVWKGMFSRNSSNLKEAYTMLEKDSDIVKNYIKKNGVNDSIVNFSAIDIIEVYEDKFGNDGRYVGRAFAGYRLEQKIEVQSVDLDKIERLGGGITELINDGINIVSYQPQYYYTKLDDIKLELISKATEDARQRAEKISENSNSKLGKLQKARMGIVQITATNSSDDYSWGGSYNTSSRFKTASITMKLDFYSK